mgnify:FL=1
MTEEELDGVMFAYTEQMVNVAISTITKIARTEGNAEDYKTWANNALDNISEIESKARIALSIYNQSK